MGLFDKVFGNGSIEDTEQSIEDAKLCKFVKEEVERIRSSATRIAHEKTWLENAAYFYGFDNVQFNYQLKIFQPINSMTSASSRSRANVNKILPTLQNRLARLVQSYPKFDVRPNGNTQEAKDNARFKLDILTNKLDELNFQNKRILLITLTQIYGHAYIVTSWNDTGGQIMLDPATGEYDFEGDMQLEVDSPLNIFPDELAKNFDECRSWTRAKVRPLSYFSSQWGEKGDKVKEEEIWLLSAQYEQKINSMSSRGFGSGSMASATKNCAIELTRYEVPSRKYPRGRMIVTAGDVLLCNKPLPTGKVPLVKYDDIVSPKYYSEAITTHLRPIQDMKSEIVRRRSEWVRKLVAGKYIEARGTELIREVLNDQSGERLQYTPVPNAKDGGMPIQLDIPNIPSFAYQEEEAIDAQFNEVSGISDVSKGVIPSAGIPAIGMQLLQEQDQTRIGIMTEQHELATAQVGKHILDYIQVCYKKSRKLKMAGPDGAYNVTDIDSNSIQGENDVIVVKGSMAPQSKTLRRQEIMNSWQNGLMGPPQDPLVIQNVVKDLEFGNNSQPYKKAALDSKQAKRFLDIIKGGEMPEISDFDNHAFILQQLNEFRISEEGTEMATQNENLKEDLELTMEGLVQFIGKMSGSIPEQIPEEIQQGIAQSSQEEAEQSVTPAADSLTQTLDNRGINQ